MTQYGINGKIQSSWFKPHMQETATESVRLADREFWRGDGGALARTLVQDPVMHK
jgi:hypothetical protein